LASELWLDVLDSAISEVDFKKQIKAKILESYHNGQKAGPEASKDAGQPKKKPWFPRKK